MTSQKGAKKANWVDFIKSIQSDAVKKEVKTKPAVPELKNS